MTDIGYFLVFCGSMLMASACTPSAIAQATNAANGVAVFSEGAHEVLAGSYQAEQEVCVDNSTTKDEALSCVAMVRESYAGAWKAYRALRFAWLGLASSIEGARLSNSKIDPAELLVKVGRLASTQEVFRQAIQPLVSNYDEHP